MYLTMPDTDPAPAGEAYVFGRFRLDLAPLRLEEHGVPVRLSGRAATVLRCLVERAGQVVSTRELLAAAWPNSAVDDANLRVCLTALRKALGECAGGGRWFENVVGRGYCFSAPVQRVSGVPACTAPAATPAERASPLIGREALVRAVAADLAAWRLVSLVGPGGMGKTSVAHAVLALRGAQPGEAVHVVDLAAVGDPALVAAAIAAQLRLQVLHADPAATLLASLRRQHALLVLDSCEHLIDAVTPLVERILREAAGVRVLATSREPLRAEGERVQRLPPLAAPAAGSTPGAAEALGYSAVQLFVERARASAQDFACSDDNAASIAAICRRLDGIPLAVELAAARVEHFGLAGVEARLADCFAVLTRGRRTALQRHQTLRATLDWSYDALPAGEQALLRRLAIFNAGFEFEPAMAVLAREGVSKAAALDGLANLLAKSLIAAEPDAGRQSYRLLDTTRAYAMDKLRAAGELRAAAQRHAAYCLDFLERAQGEWSSAPAGRWLVRYGRRIVDVRAALDWAFGADGDGAAGCAIAIASAPLWYQLSMLGEYREQLGRALRVAEAQPEPCHQVRMQLHLALGHVLMHAGGGSARSQECSLAFDTAVALAEAGGESSAMLRALWGAFAYAIYCGEYRQALDFAQRYGRADAGRPGAGLSHACLVATAMHYAGEHNAIRPYLEQVLADPDTRLRHSHHAGFQVDQRILVLAIRARTEWLQGASETALRTARASIDEGVEVGHPISLCFALTVAVTVALWAGQDGTAAGYLALLDETVRKSALPNWRFWERCFTYVLELRAGRAAPAAEGMQELLRSPLFSPLHSDALATFDARLLSPLALARAVDGRAGASTPEILRLQGETALLSGEPDGAAEALFLRAIGCARSQGALAWELRAATSLAHLWRRQGRLAEACDMLAATCARYTQRLGNPDLNQALALMAALDTGFSVPAPAMPASRARRAGRVSRSLP